MGTALPGRVYSDDLDRKLALPVGTIKKRGGIEYRHFAGEEIQSELGARAARVALLAAGLALDDIDCVVAASGVPEQAIPATSVLIARELGLESGAVGCFDVNATCLSFVVALDTLSALLAVGRYKRVLLVSADLPSKGLDWGHLESAAIFGDGAVAVVLEHDPSSGSAVLGAQLETYPQGWRTCQITGGGSRCNPQEDGDVRAADFKFQMDGKAVFKLASRVVPGALERFWAKTGLTMADIDVVVPHQASQLGLHHMRKLLDIPESRIVDIFAHHGNQVSASIPTALYEAVQTGRLQRGQTALLIGTGAGLSVGILALRY
ncbi:3-oxoacyl-[acyl-carrier-protein] synthase III C-terminal domain-containing protein [Paraburkholderia sp. UCT31]|uniref:3-oxoacyl-[acyl-carrier-protein] synthase III C-terminal domain-containing protein n=1 Tax=Paraburkholderia sp. UCT31 TaxID=2615209 RepID=UPI00223AE186|nr:3-oxoacyl-[acyl-carrier-protein] synthase III C-terminal domain-containing protein [Paraburkholderia sp. UCT31]